MENTTSRKIIAREVEPENIDFSYYFDNYGLTSEAGENYAVYIVPTRYSNGFNADEYNSIMKTVENLFEAFDNMNTIYSDYNSYKEAMEDNYIEYNSTKCHKLKKLLECDSVNAEVVAEYLTITTGKQYTVAMKIGYSQGDNCKIIYCKDIYTDEAIDEIGKMWLGCATEFCIDDCYGFYVLDTIRWTEDERLVNKLADMYGCKPEELEVQIYTGNHRVNDYKTLTA